MIDSNNKLKTLSKALLESAQMILSEKKADKDLAALAPPRDKVTHADVLVGRGVYTHDQVKAHKAKKGIKEDAELVIVHAPVLEDIHGELAEVLRRDPRDNTLHVACEGVRYVLKKDQYRVLPEMADDPCWKGYEMVGKKKKGGKEVPNCVPVKEEIEELDEKAKGLWANIHAKRKRIESGSGERMRKPGSEGAPTDKNIKAAQESVELTQEEIDRLDSMMAEMDAIDEGRGRPPKPGSAAHKARMAQDLSDMPALSVQVRKAASINKPVTFMSGETKEISNNHIDKFNDHMAAHKTSQDKAAFQKKAHKSHADFIKAVSEPIPGISKDTGEIVKYRH